MSRVVLPHADKDLEQALADAAWQRVGDDFHGDGLEMVWMTGPHGRWTGQDRYGRPLTGPAGRGRYFLRPSAAIRAVLDRCTRRRQPQAGTAPTPRDGAPTGTSGQRVITSPLPTHTNPPPEGRSLTAAATATGGPPNAHHHHQARERELAHR